MENRINPPPKDFDKKPRRKYTWIYILIIILLLGTNIYLFLQRNGQQKEKAEMAATLQNTISKKDTLKTQYNAALIRLDQLKGKNSALREDLNKKNSKIKSLKNRISGILANEHATKAQLKQAQQLINQLKDRISKYQNQEVALKQAKLNNAKLKLQKDSIIASNKSMEKKIKAAQLPHASNIKMFPIMLRRGGKKESRTDKARKVDLLRIAFDINKNNLIQTGIKEFDIRLVNPNGRLLKNKALGSGSFINPKGETVQYSLSKEVKLTSGVPLKNIAVDWQQADAYQKGPYIVDIYYQGHLIGQGTVILK